jgi:hypothetical protein
MTETTKITIATMQKDIEYINENIGKIEGYIKEDRAWKLDFEKCLDTKYAGKWTESLTLGALLAAVGAIISTIFNKL